MNIVYASDYDELSQIAAQAIQDYVREHPDGVLGLATGDTPIGTYRELARRHQAGEISLRSVTTFNLDEYYGLPADHPQSYRTYMTEHLFRHVDIDGDRIHIPSGVAADADAHCREYDRKIADAGGIGLQLLGLGGNGHIGFNEPDVELKEGSHLVQLSDETIRANSRNFASVDEVPRQAITVGLGAIFRARKIVMLASGKAKAPIAAQLVRSGVTTQIPATLLKLHPDVTVVLDKEAASGLPEA